MKVFVLPERAAPRDQGRAHGEAFRPLIREIAELRTELTITNGRFDSSGAVLEAARAHLPVLERFSEPLFEELLGIAEGAAIEPERVVVLNHYTDLKDLDPASVAADDSCSAVFARTEGDALLGQTWDMHGSATPYVMMLGVPRRGELPAAWLFTLTGCLGMAGLNERGVGITINNLRSTDARVGLVWPALVRDVLEQLDAPSGREVVLQAPLGSGHHYMVGSHEAVFGIETSGAHRRLVFEDGRGTFVHTNHCFDPVVEDHTTVGPESTTHVRHEWLVEHISERAIHDRADLWKRLGSHDGHPRGVCTHLASPARPHAMATCGALVMSLASADLWAAQGCIHRALPHRFGFGSDGTPQARS